MLFGPLDKVFAVGSDTDVGDNRQTSGQFGGERIQSVGAARSDDDLRADGVKNTGEANAEAR